MAKFIVNTTIQTRDKNGDKLVIMRSPEPQDIPAGLVKELRARGAIEAPAGAVALKKPGGGPTGSDDGGTGDDESGD